MLIGKEEEEENKKEKKGGKGGMFCYGTNHHTDSI
jgi:hypothetical protein